MWHEEVDLLVLGTGAGGLAAAVTGAAEGLSTLVLEKTEWLGGTTAYSAGTCWIPDNRFQRADGVTDDHAVASRYLDALVGDRAPRELREAYLTHGPEMIDYFDGARRAVLAFEEGRRLPPGDRRRGPGRPGAGAADVRRPHAGQGELRPRPSPGAGVRPVRRHPDGAPGRGQRAAHDLQGLAPRRR